MSKLLRLIAFLWVFGWLSWVSIVGTVLIALAEPLLPGTSATVLRAALHAWYPHVLGLAVLIWPCLLGFAHLARKLKCQRCGGFIFVRDVPNDWVDKGWPAHRLAVATVLNGPQPCWRCGRVHPLAPYPEPSVPVRRLRPQKKLRDKRGRRR